MFHRAPSEKKSNAEQYLDGASEHFVFDITSGIYKPNTHQEKKKRSPLQAVGHGLLVLVRDIKRHWLPIIISGLTLFFLIRYTHYSRLQWREMKRAADEANAATALARSTLETTKSHFRADQRPYIWFIPEIPFEPVKRANSGVMAGHLDVLFEITNYGKSPAINVRVDSHLVFGPNAWKKVRLREIDQKEGTGSIVAPGGRMDSIGYSDEVVSKPITGREPEENAPYIIYGHFEYTDLVSNPPVVYISEFCSIITNATISNASSGLRDADIRGYDTCRAHNNLTIKKEKQ
jgi:hypothetical protein